MRIVFLLFMVSVSSYGQATITSCPEFGTTFDSGQYSTEDSLFLNIQSPSQCHGNITQWKFCFRRNGNGFNEVQFMVFRQNGRTLTYERVINSRYVFQERQLPFRECRSIVLDTNEIFETKPNDIIAACMRNQGSTDPLRVTIFSENQALRINGFDDDCRDDELQSLNFESLSCQVDNVLLVQAIINTTVENRIGHNPSPSRAIDTNGIFINTEFPAQCNGLVTSWNYCYYNDSVSSSDQNFSAIFSVWRNNSQSSNLTMVSGSSVTVTLQPQFTIATIHCQVVELEPENNVIVLAGDYVGVAFPQNNPIPMIGSSNNFILLQHIDDTELSISSNSLIQTTGALHLYANIDMTVEIPTTVPETNQPFSEPPVSTFQFNQDETTSTEGSEVSQSVTGIIVAILVTILMIAGIITIMCIVIFVFRWKKKMSKLNDVTQDTSMKGIDNVNYGSHHEVQVHKEVKDTNTMPVTASGQDFNADNYYQSVSDPSQQKSILEASFYSSLNIYNDNIYASVMDEESTYYELEPIYFQEPYDEEEHLYGQIYSDINRARNIDRNTIKFSGHLGSGQFGNVEKGIWFDGYQDIEVALKTLRENATPEDKVKFLQEAVIMAQFDHDNVIKLLATVLEDNPMILVVELASRGDLRKNLLDIRAECADPNLPELLLYFSRQILHGMHYLSSKNFVHRDLAARNILLSDNCLCKIADFGMSRDLADDTYYASSGGLVPVKWTAPEAIKFRKYSTASDVWSYGCVLYEIWSLGHKPFESLQNSEIIATLDKGIRLPPPTGCPKEIYATMIKCWHGEPSSRPTFQELVPRLTRNQDILVIPDLILKTIPGFRTPGGSLDDGRHVYRNLQDIYVR